MHTLPSSFLFPIINYHCINCNLKMYQEKGQYPRGGWERLLEKMFIGKLIRILNLKTISSFQVKMDEVEAETLKYLNRLSDFLFTLARHAAKLDGKAEHIYVRPGEHRCTLVDATSNGPLGLS